MKMTLALGALLMLMVAGLLSACGQDAVFVMVVTATPETGGTSEPSPVATDPATSAATVDSAATAVTVPTPTIRQIYVAEQVFQRGRMFWLEPTGQIWVLTETEPGIGIWQVYEDLFEEGGTESDPNLIPPDGLMQPVRGFGLVWRSNPGVRDGLGWALDTELGFVANYEYHPSGEVVDNVFIPAPGYHFLQSVFGDWLRLNEVNSTWQEIERATSTATPTP